jgi:hypothetical protein
VNFLKLKITMEEKTLKINKEENEKVEILWKEFEIIKWEIEFDNEFKEDNNSSSEEIENDNSIELDKIINEWLVDINWCLNKESVVKNKYTFNTIKIILDVLKNDWTIEEACSSAWISKQTFRL